MNWKKQMYVRERLIEVGLEPPLTNYPESQAWVCEVNLDKIPKKKDDCNSFKNCKSLLLFTTKDLQQMIDEGVDAVELMFAPGNKMFVAKHLLYFSDGQEELKILKQF